MAKGRSRLRFPDGRNEIPVKVGAGMMSMGGTGLVPATFSMQGISGACPLCPTCGGEKVIHVRVFHTVLLA